MPATLRDRAEEESQTDTMDATCNIWSSANLAFFFLLSSFWGFPVLHPRPPRNLNNHHLYLQLNLKFQPLYLKLNLVVVVVSTSVI
jgi:hypothetical protein